MDKLLRDACYRELQLAIEACNDYVPLTAMQYYIEAEEDPQIAETKANNQKAASSAWDHIKKAINAIKVAIGNLLRRVADVFSKASMDKQTREAYEAYKKACAENPELAKKKVTATDFKKSEEVYKKILKETEDAEKRIAAGEHVDVPSVLKRCEQYASEMGKGVATAVGAQTLLNMARSNQTMAKAISFALNSDARILAGIEEQIGKENTDNLNNEVAKMTQRCTIYRARLKWHKRYFEDIGASFKGAIDGLKDAAIPSTSVKGNLRKATQGNAKETDKLLRGNETVARTLNARDEALKTGAKEVAKDKLRAPIDRYNANKYAKQEARREAKGDYSGADLGTYVRHSIDNLRKKEK